MSDYISREETVKQITKVAEQIKTNNAPYIFTALYINNKEDFPSADVRENIHGKWEHGRYRSVDQTGETYDDGEAIICSVCHYAFKERYLWSRNFCPNCGADMRGKVE